MDILKAKGVLSQEDVQELRASSGKGGTGADNQAALISPLKAKGILNDQDLRSSMHQLAFEAMLTNG